MRQAPGIWEGRRDEVIRIVRGSQTVSEVLGKLTAATGSKITEDALVAAWRRWRGSWPEIPRIPDVLGADLSHTQGGDASPGIEPPPPREIVQVRGVKPSDPAVDHSVDTDKHPDGFLFCTSDHHHNISDRLAEAAVMQCARDLRPKTWVFNGDVVDAWWISLHEKEADRIFDDAGPRLVDEIDSFREFSVSAAEISKTIYVGEGNHERRLSVLIHKNPGLHGLPSLAWRSLMSLPANCHHLSYGYRLKVGPVAFVHGDRMGGRFGVKHAAAWALDNQGARTVIFGHTHRLESKYRTTWSVTGEPEEVVAINQGHLSDVSKQRYVSEPNWQTGFVIVEFYSIGGKQLFSAHPICIVDGRFSFGGKLYDGRKVA